MIIARGSSFVVHLPLFFFGFDFCCKHPLANITNPFRVNQFFGLLSHGWLSEDGRWSVQKILLS